MSSPWRFFSEFTISTAVHLFLIFVIALLLNRFLRAMTHLIVKPGSSQSRASQIREQQTRTVAGVLYSAASKAVWIVALLMALETVNVNVTPALTLAGLASVAIGFGAQTLIRDLIAGFYIVAEDQFVVGDTIQVGDTVGRVEHLTLRRTVVRDARGALVTVGNGEIRTVSNLSRDWSQAFVDIVVGPESIPESTLQALEAAAAELRGDPAWAQALVDGPRILGVQNFDRDSSTVRLQVRTAPTRQDEVARELRRRIQIEFSRRGIPVSNVRRIEVVGATPPPGASATENAG